MADIIETQTHSLLKLTEKGGSGEIDHTEIFTNQMSKLCMSEEFSDVTFEIQDEKIPGHVAILATRNDYFRALLFGGLSESKQKLFKLQVPIEAFKALLKYMYSGHLSLSQMREEDILDTLSFVNQCACTELELSISEYLTRFISLDNVWAILNTAKVHSLEMLQKSCYKFLDTNANGVLVHESFKNLSKEALKDIISRDTFSAPEFQIFTAVSEWCKHNSIPIESVISVVRLPLISVEKLLKVVRHSGIPNSIVLDAIDEKTTSTSLSYRAALWQEENVATEKFGAHVIEGENGSALLDGNITSYYGYGQHRTTNDNGSGIIVELGSVTFINHIKLLLLDLDERFNSYFVDVSVDKTQWETVVDRKSCSSWQFLYFPSRAVRYIKLVGTYGSKRPMLEVVSLEAYYTAKVPKMIDGVNVPTKNVATKEMGAVVINGSYPEYLLNGDINNYDSQTGYTWHYIGGDYIMVRLGQPYVIGSMRLLLWGGDNRNYSFYIETSINNKDWTLVVDKRNESSWQNLVFEPRAMVFIRIVETHCNFDNEYFNCVHFECPSQKLNTTDEEQEGKNKMNDELETLN